MFTPLTLPNGSRLTNRLAKAAMEENLAAPGQLPGPALWRLYRYCRRRRRLDHHRQRDDRRPRHDRPRRRGAGTKHAARPVRNLGQSRTPGRRAGVDAA